MITNDELRAIAKRAMENTMLQVGVRSLCDDEHYKIGDVAREAYSWNFDTDESMYDVTGESAGWTAATGLEEPSILYYEIDAETIEEVVAAIKETIEFNKHYGGKTQVVLLGEEAGDDPNDEREIDLIDPEVVGIV